MARPTPKQSGIAAATLAAILSATYAVEGGYVNNPHDRGGPTNLGVTERTAREHGYLGDMRNFPKHCYDTMTTCADKIYTQTYVYGPGFGPMLYIEPAVAKSVVDIAVNMGPAVSTVFFQQGINATCPSAKIKVDGRVGDLTIAAYDACKHSQGAVPFCVAMLNKLDALKERRYRGIVARDPSQRIFLKGWLRWRINNVPRSECGKGDS